MRVKNDTIPSCLVGPFFRSGRRWAPSVLTFRYLGLIISFHPFSTLLRSLLSSLPYAIIPTPNSQISTIPRTTNLRIPLTRQPVPPAISHPRPNLNRKALPQLRNKIYFRQRRQTSAPPMKGNDSSESGILCFQFVWFPPTETAGTRYTFVKKWYPY